MQAQQRPAVFCIDVQLRMLYKRQALCGFPSTDSQTKGTASVEEQQAATKAFFGGVLT
jgi:hypothetical protein